MDFVKQKAGPTAIIIAVIALAGFLFFLGKKTLGPRQPDVSPDAAPQYAKDMMKKGGANNPYAGVMPAQGQTQAGK